MKNKSRDKSNAKNHVTYISHTIVIVLMWDFFIYANKDYSNNHTPPPNWNKLFKACTMLALFTLGFKLWLEKSLYSISKAQQRHKAVYTWVYYVFPLFLVAHLCSDILPAYVLLIWPDLCVNRILIIVFCPLKVFFFASCHESAYRAIKHLQ